MADINLTKTGLPFLLSGSGTLTVHATVGALNQPLTPPDADLLSADFGAAGDQSFTFGAADTIKLGIKAQSKNRLYALWPPRDFESSLRRIGSALNQLAKLQRRRERNLCHLRSTRRLANFLSRRSHIVAHHHLAGRNPASDQGLSNHAASCKHTGAALGPS